MLIIDPQMRSRLLALLLVLLAWNAGHPSSVQAQCPKAAIFTGDGASSDLDLGWTGIGHDTIMSGVGLTVATGFTLSSPACQNLPITDLITNAGGTNRRCAASTDIACVSDGECGVVGPCHYFMTPPMPFSAGGVGFCFVHEVAGTVTGGVNAAAGGMTASIPLAWRMNVGITADTPCPTCDGDATENDGLRGGTCTGGTRNGETCDANFTSPVLTFGTTSHDCPPSPGTAIGSIASPSVPLALSSGTQTRTLTAAQPSCRAPGFTGNTCFCDTCNNLAATPCSSNADCTAVGATTCGGRRCLGGTNQGTPCTAASECPASGCGVAGVATQPHGCNDDTTTAGLACVDTAPLGDGEAECVDGPVGLFCAAPEQYRFCNVPADCPLTGDCSDVRIRECYGTNGALGDTVSAVGMTDTPVGDLANPTLAGMVCLSPTASAAVNTGGGLPGLGRLRLPGTLLLAQEVVSLPVAADGTISTGSVATSSDPIETSVTSPNPGLMTIVERNTVGSPPAGFSFVNQQVDVTAPAASAADPLVLVFTISYTRLGGVPGTTCSDQKVNVTVKKDGVDVPTCADVMLPPHTIPPIETCVANRECPNGENETTGDVRITIWSTSASTWQFQLPVEAPVALLAGKKLLLKDAADEPTKRQLGLQLKDPTIDVQPATMDDPTCGGPGGGGASLTVFGAGGSDEYLSVHLPCERWQPIGDPADGKGFKYSDTRQTLGPCKTVLLKNRKVMATRTIDGQIKATCSGKNPAFPLDYDLESGEGRVGVVFRSGTGQGYCADFGGTITKDLVTSFQAKDAGAPGVCPAH
jgi:hypothetical protein